ncbi:SsgA family sporulation/cell division regulator [Streptomyces noursei]
MKRWVRMHYVDNVGEATAVWGTWEYSADTPLAVSMTCPVPDRGGWSTWVFARSLLVTGTYVASGVGNVRVWPVVDEDAEAVCIALSNGTEHAMFRVERAAVLAWTADILRWVPPDVESRLLDIDGCIERILKAREG